MKTKELEDKIKLLELRIAKLESEPRVTYIQYPWQWPQIQPQYPYIQPWVTYTCGNTSNGTTTTASIKGD